MPRWDGRQLAYQDGSRAEIETEVVMMYETRIDNLANIMLDGVGTSNASRTIVGLKCDAGQEVSHDGGTLCAAGLLHRLLHRSQGPRFGREKLSQNRR